MALALNTSPLATVPLLFSACRNLIAVFFLSSIDPIIFHGRRGQARYGGDLGGEHADEPASPTYEVRLTLPIYDDELF